MSNCGCTTTTSCYEHSNVVQQALLPITQNNCYGTSTGASNCPVYFEPSTLTAENTTFVVPAVGATTNLPLLCNANKFRVGMWIENPAYGKYPIVGVNAATNILTLQNSCSDGETAIPGNPDPGTQITGQQSIWISGADPCRDAEAFCSDAIECLQSISDNNPLCTEDWPEATSGECGNPMILTSACDAGDCPQPDDPNCWKKLPGIRLCNDSIVFADGLAVAEDNECFRPVVVTESGNIKEAPAGAGVIKPVKAYIGRWESGYTSPAGIVAAMNFSFNLNDFNIPDCAVGCCIRALYSYDYDDDAGDGPNFITYLRATGQPVQNIAYQINRVAGISGTSVADRGGVQDSIGMISVTFGPDKIVFHELKDEGTQGTNNVVLQLWLDAIIL